MSALGQKQTIAPQKVISALPRKADMGDEKTPQSSQVTNWERLFSPGQKSANF
jgi:hypothetical protein